MRIEGTQGEPGSACLALEELLDALDGGEAPVHVAGCAACQALFEELRAVQAAARDLPPSGWAGGMGPGVDVEAALAAVLRRHARRRLPLRLVRLTSAAAAVLVTGALGAPLLLRRRIESEAATPPFATASAAPWHHAPARTVFWTSR